MRHYSTKQWKLEFIQKQCRHTESRAKCISMPKKTPTPQPAAPWAPLWRNRSGSASLLCLHPLSTASCFLTKPTPPQADPVIMRLCPEPRAAGERCQQLGADLLNGPLLLLAVLGREQISPRGNSPCPKLKLSICGAVASRAYATTH